MTRKAVVRVIAREFYMKQIRNYMNTPVVKVITGMRRSGKSVMLEAISDNYEKLVISTDSLIRFDRNGIKHKNIIDFLLEK